jgi:hypothetical protein
MFSKKENQSAMYTACRVEMFADLTFHSDNEINELYLELSSTKAIHK